MISSLPVFSDLGIQATHHNLYANIFCYFRTRYFLVILGLTPHSINAFSASLGGYSASLGGYSASLGGYSVSLDAPL